TADDAPRLTTGSLVEVVYQNGSGIYRFESGVLANPPGEMELSHSERLERVQRREYYRGRVRLPVYVKLAREPERPERTQLIDVGGGGASFRAPDPRFQRGEHVELTFHPDSAAPLHLPGRIVRESKGGRVAHVSFDDLTPSTRDRVYGFLFQRQARGAR
ncbi:MAG TPA: PilZ domain-containing protein, partial [Spirochaetia bacterium]|nr:PilZ domain-containing protein [Spirochaetia bacterium]